MLHISGNIKLIRELSGKTQAEFGQKFDATKAMIISYEKGKAQPSFLFIDRLAKHTGLQATQIMKQALKEEDVDKEKLEKLFNVEKVSRETPVENKENQVDTPNTSSLEELIACNKYLSRATLIQAEADKIREEKELALVKNNSSLTDLLKQKGFTANEPGDNLLGHPSVISKLLETLAELGAGNLWDTKEDGMILLNNRLTAPIDEVKNKVGNPVAAGKKSIARQG